MFHSIEQHSAPFLARRRLHSAICFSQLALLAVMVASVCGQPAAVQPVTGLLYFSVENLDSQRAEQRGIAGSAGVAFDRLNLASNTRYRIWLLEAATFRVADVEIRTAGPGRALRLPAFLFRQASSHDTDGDELHDLGEFIVGTNPFDRDSDKDGIPDGAEVRQGLDPVSGLAARTGIVDSADTPGSAVDICAINDVAVVADRTAGVAVFNVFNGMNAVLIAQVDTPGQAQAVACAGNLIAVADGPSGLAVIDFSDPPAARIIHQVNLGSHVLAVVVAGPTAYAGLASGHIASVDLPTGTLLDRIPLRGGPVQDVAIGGDTLYALVVGTLHALPLLDGGLQIAGSVDSPGSVGAGRRRLRLFAGERLLYATYLSGYNIFDISNPALPRFVRTVTTAQRGWKQIVANGSGIGMAAVSPNSTDDGPHHVSLYNLGPDHTGSEFVATFETPGLAAALSIYNGIAYVADSGAGMQVINYLAYDSLGVAPQINLETSFASGAAEEGKLMRVSARVSDDVQVRNVEFYRDGIRVATDGNFPFEHRFITPLIAGQREFFALRARASDTGGNATWSDELMIQLVPDATPPSVRRTVPFDGALVGAVRSLAAFFSEPMVPASINNTSVRLVSAGPDDLFDTPDDTALEPAKEYRGELNAVFITTAGPLGPGNYRLLLSPPAADLAGNVLASPTQAAFRVYSFTDEDQDGIPDELEPSLGFDPAKTDSDGNGIPDGLEDLDGDGLPTGWEILNEYNPQARDSDANGTDDGDEDPDREVLVNRDEFLNGTNPRKADTDGDGWNDEAEATGRSDPLNPASTPRLLFVGRPNSLRIGLARFVADFANGVTVGGPPLQIGLPRFVDEFANGVVVGRPPLQMGLAGFTEDITRGIVVAQPVLTIGLPGLQGFQDSGVTVAQPPLIIQLNSQ